MRLKVDGETVEQPTWDQIEEALMALDGDSKSFIALERGENNEHISVGGGTRYCDGRFVVPVGLEGCVT